VSKFWSNIFEKKTTPKEEIVEEERGPHMPPKELPIEQTFAENLQLVAENLFIVNPCKMQKMPFYLL
jgi:hypothetical protein